MKFHVYAINWNEERLLPLFFRHYMQADKIFILDNYSTDQSHSIIKAHGGILLPFDTKQTLLDAENSRQKNKVWKQSVGEADFVIVQDLDEFLFFPEYPNDIRAGLAAAHARDVTVIQARGLQMFSTDAAFEKIRGDSTQHITTALWNGTHYHPIGNYDKCLAFNPNKIQEMNYNVGAHDATPAGTVTIDTKSALLLHYKFMGYDYLFARYKKIRDRLSPENKARHWGKQYDRPDEEIERYLKPFFTKYLSDSLFSMMYPDKMKAAFQYKDGRCVLNTFGPGDYISRALLQGSIWEPTVAEFLYSLCALAPRSTAFFDIGANIGAHTAIARLAGTSLTHSFECNPTTYGKLKDTVDLNGWTDVYLWNVAVSDCETQLPFKIVPDNVGASYIETTHKGWPGTTQPGGTVSSIALDTFAPKFDKDLSGVDTIIVKMDVEGHELQALRGMQAFLKRPAVRHFIIEINPVCSDDATVQAELELLESCGLRPTYLLFEVPGSEWSGKELASIQPESLPRCSKEYILAKMAQKHVLEVYFTK